VNLGRSVMGGRIAAGPTWGTGKYIFDHLESISFLRSATIIHKRGPRGEEGAVEFGLRYIEDNAQAFESEARTRLAEYILKFGGSLDVAAAQLDRAVEISGDPAEVLAVRWQVKMKQNKLGEAIADISRAAELAGTNVGYWLRASALEGQRSGDSGAAEVLRRALNVMPGQPRLATRLKQVSGV
jgi:tetratricopeptide (TPR) repeat protein